MAATTTEEKTQSTINHPETLLHWALKYRAMGFSVIAVFRPGQMNFRGEISDGKDPAVTEVTTYREQIATLEELERWFANNTERPNIGVITGKTSSIIGLDIEGENSKRIFQNSIKSGSSNLRMAIDNTMHVRTGGGNALILLRFKKEDFPQGIENEKIISYPNHDEIAISGNGRYVVMPPSVHKSGKRYDLLSDNLITLTKDEVNELLKILRALKAKRNDGRIPKENSFGQKFAELEDAAITQIADKLKPVYIDGSRHDTILRFAGYARKFLYFKKDDVHKISEAIDPGDRKNFDAIEDTYRKDLTEINGYYAFEEILLLLVKDVGRVADIFATLTKYKPKTSWIDQLSPEIAIQLRKHVFEVTSYDPLKFVIAHTEFNQVVDASIKSSGKSKHVEGREEEKEEEGETNVVRTLKIEGVIISAIPSKITCYDNPTHSQLRYEIEFETSNGKVFTIPPKTIEELVADLRARGLVYNIRYAEQKLAAILNAYQKAGKVTFNREIETPGFYLTDGKVSLYKTSGRQPTTEEIKECITILDKLAITWNRKEIFPTYLKWGLVSPFSYILKNYNWMHWLYPYGWTRTGKSQLGAICALAPWRKHNDFTNHRIPFTKFDTEARIGHHISQDTFPIVVNECGALGEEKYRHLVEMIKNLVENKVARGKFTGKHSYEEIPALSPCILTGNFQPPDDPAFRARIIPIRFTTEDETTEKQNDDFNFWIKENIDKLGVLGDFAANYVLEHQDILKKDWREIGKIILEDFYKSAGIQKLPQWIDYFVEESQILDAKQDILFDLRGFFLNVTNDAYTKHYRTFTDNEDQGMKHESLEERVTFCCSHRLISFLIQKTDTGEIVITSNIMRELKRYKINQISSLAELARLIGFQYGSIWTDKTIKAAHGSKSKFIEFLDINSNFSF